MISSGLRVSQGAASNYASSRRQLASGGHHLVKAPVVEMLTHIYSLPVISPYTHQVDRPTPHRRLRGVTPAIILSGCLISWAPFFALREFFDGSTCCT